MGGFFLPERGQRGLSHVRGRPGHARTRHIIIGGGGRVTPPTCSGRVHCVTPSGRLGRTLKTVIPAKAGISTTYAPRWHRSTPAQGAPGSVPTFGQVCAGVSADFRTRAQRWGRRLGSAPGSVCAGVSADFRTRAQRWGRRLGSAPGSVCAGVSADFRTRAQRWGRRLVVQVCCRMQIALRAGASGAGVSADFRTRAQRWGRRLVVQVCCRMQIALRAGASGAPPLMRWQMDDSERHARVRARPSKSPA